jgi:hypothetical protein
MIEYLPLVLTGIGIIVSILYYSNVLRNANKTQQMQLETRQVQLFMQMYTRFQDKIEDLDMESVIWNKLSGFEEYQEKEQTDPNFRKSSICIL